MWRRNWCGSLCDGWTVQVGDDPRTGNVSVTETYTRTYTETNIYTYTPQADWVKLGLDRHCNTNRYAADTEIVKKRSEEMQTLRAGCSKAEPKKFAPPQTPFPRAWDGQNLISWGRSLPLPTNPVWWGSMHAISSYRGNRPTHTQTDRTATASVQCNTEWHTDTSTRMQPPSSCSLEHSLRSMSPSVLSKMAAAYRYFHGDYWVSELLSINCLLASNKTNTSVMFSYSWYACKIFLL